jgi:amino acid permease
VPPAASTVVTIVSAARSSSISSGSGARREGDVQGLGAGARVLDGVAEGADEGRLVGDEQVGAPAGAGAMKRRVGVSDAVLIGLGSVIGAGIFAALGPASGAAGSGLLLALALAAVVAYSNATSSARLAAL